MAKLREGLSDKSSLAARATSARFGRAMLNVSKAELELIDIKKRALITDTERELVVEAIESLRLAYSLVREILTGEVDD